MPDSSTRFIGERGWTEGGGNKCKRWREMIGMRWRLIEEEVRKGVEVGEREKRGGRHFLLHLLLLSFHLKLFSFHLQSSFDVHSFFMLVFSTISTVSYVSQYFNLALMLFFHPLLLIDVLLGRKYMGFSHSSTGPIPTPTTHTHSFSVFPPDSLCLMSEGKVLKKTTHIPPQSILGVCWNFMPLVVPSTLTVRFYGNTIIRGRLWDENISASGLKRHLCLMI